MLQKQQQTAVTEAKERRNEDVLWGPTHQLREPAHPQPLSERPWQHALSKAAANCAKAQKMSPRGVCVCEFS